MHAPLPMCMRWRAGRWLWCWVERVLGGRRCRRSRCCRRSQRCRRSLGGHAVSERPGDGSVQALVFMALGPSPRNHDQLCILRQPDYECEQSVEHPPGLHRAVNQDGLRLVDAHHGGWGGGAGPGWGAAGGRAGAPGSWPGGPGGGCGPGTPHSLVAGRQRDHWLLSLQMIIQVHQQASTGFVRARYKQLPGSPSALEAHPGGW